MAKDIKWMEKEEGTKRKGAEEEGREGGKGKDKWEVEKTNGWLKTHCKILRTLYCYQITEKQK